MPIELPKDIRTQSVASIQRYFRENMEEPIGNLDAEALLDFFLQEIGPVAYNKAGPSARASRRNDAIGEFAAPGVPYIRAGCPGLFLRGQDNNPGA